MKKHTIDPLERIIIALFRFFEFNDLANKWEAESPTWAKYTSKVSKILTVVSTVTASSDKIFEFLPENWQTILFTIAAINTSITFYANLTVKTEE